MKEYTTRFLKSVALFYMGFPVFHIILAALLFDIPGNECVKILLTPSYYAVSFLAAISGYGLWEMRRWSWYLFVISNFMVAYENAVFVNVHGNSHHPVAAFLLSLLVVGLLVYRVSKEVRVPYFFPKIRWWESDPRYKLSVPTSINRHDGGDVVEGQIMDLSMTGCFIRLRGDLKRNEKVTVGFSVFGFLVNCSGAVVWLTQSTVTHPKGIGIKFSEMSRTDRRHLRYICRKLKKIATFYRRSRYLLNQEEFIKRLQEIETSRVRRRGFIRKNEGG